MADVLLIYPKAGHDVRGVSVNAPMALLTLAARLVPDFSVEILDQRACDDFWPALERALRGKPLIVGITSMTGTQIFHGLEISMFVRERSSTPVVWGGMHPTIYAAQTVAKPYIDFVIRGEGEVTLRRLVETLARGSTDFDRIPGLVFKRGGVIHGTAEGEPIDLENVPWLPWHLVSVEEYVSPAQYLYTGVTRLLPYQASRGCPFKCTFCSEPVLTKKYRMMPAARVAEETLRMVAAFKLDHITFFDEEFFIHAKWATAVAEAIGGRFTWWAQTRAADLIRVDLKKMEKCGLLILAPGLESGSDRVLASMKKFETVEHYRKADEKVRETGIVAQYN
ncbi:MAG: B12-binding domain-containing radical SAM protein, partial [Elusimicrobia bacterium]|nr:B12-binding domain-containing radical SAM protein [Elusimicrobiota bacterium]